ncbi:hypothetical protein L226DRAFT_435711, partial [Lentinus tigrinus ALCF2SS1-7]
PVVTASWKQPYVGNSDVLESVLEGYMTKPGGVERYARYASITQSSGTGKSRMVDELAKKVFCISMNLGSKNAYPPPDVAVQAWFQSLKVHRIDEWDRRVQVFIYVLFQTALKHAQTINSDKTKNPSQIASEFRSKMSEGMVYGRHGTYRQKFYDEVCTNANKVVFYSAQYGLHDKTQCSQSPIVNIQDETGDVSNVKDAAKALTDYLKSALPPKTVDKHSKPLVIVCFDEAQLLTDSSFFREVTPFPVVRRVLRIFRVLPIFALFLSTVAQLEQFPPPPPFDSSARVVRTVLRPFEPIVWTPLDVFAQRFTKTKAGKAWTLAEVASTHHIVHLGRPLFPAMYDAAGDDERLKNNVLRLAGNKLLYDHNPTPASMSKQQALACIAVRIPINFSAVQLSQPRNEEDVAAVERTLVANHMRLLLYAGAGFSPIITASASEPFLAEAAYLAMVQLRWSDGRAKEPADRAGLEPFTVFSHYLRESLLDLGPRGEIATALLLLYARDCATTFPLLNTELPPGAGS